MRRREGTPSGATSLLVALTALWLFPSIAAADAEAGKAIYMQNCLSCHGATGQGDGPVGAALTPRPRDFSKGEFKFDADNDGTQGSDEDLNLVITNGAGAYGGSPLMAPWGHLPEKDRENVIVFIRSLKTE
ncbi:MAG: cytochrome c [Myxococcota bacterium]